MKDFRDLQVWQKAHALTLDVYRETRGFPSEELYGLTSQLHRACSSIAANLAEGCGRSGDADVARFVQISMGSACEAEYHLLLARDLNLINLDRHGELNSAIVEVKRMLAGFLKKLRADR